MFTFVPPNGVASVSSLSVKAVNFGCWSGEVIITEVSPELRRPPSSRNFKITSPSIAGISVSDMFPDNEAVPTYDFSKIFATDDD